MLYKDIKVGATYKTQSLLQDIEVKIVAKKKVQDYYRIEYEYPKNFQPWGATKGWQFSHGQHFPNIQNL